MTTDDSGGDELADDRDVVNSGILPRYCEKCDATRATRSHTGETYVKCCTCGHVWWPTTTE